MKKNNKRIKLFLGGYVDFLNAQNINCRALSEHLDKDKFEIMTMRFCEGMANAKDFEPSPGVRYLKLHRPARLDLYRIYAHGIAWADVAYLPKGEVDGFCRWWAQVCGTKLFTTLEGVLDETLLSRQLNPTSYIEHFRKHEPRLYSITKFMKLVEKQSHNLNCRDTILYLGTEVNNFLNPHAPFDGLKNVVFIGNDLIRKNVKELLELSKSFPDVTFNIIGGNQLENCTIEEYIKQEGLSNVTYHGRLDHASIAKVLSTMDIMFFPSRSEGFPKVHLETACAGVPTICYSDYGASEWITTGKDGFVVDTCDEAIAILRDLQQHPDKLQELSRNAVELGKRFDWSVLVKEWEKVISEIYNEK